MHLRRIKLLAVLAPISGLTAFEVFRHVVLHPALGETGPHVTEHVLSAAVVIAGALAFTFLVFRLLERLHGQLVALNEAAIAVSSDLSLEGVLAQVADLARQVAGVPHASVVIDGPPHAEVTSGTAPPIGAQLEIRIVARGQRLGELRLTAEPGRGFRPSDRNALTVFATQAGVAIENAHLFAQVQELVRMRERERIGMDLHDGVVQNLYGLGLKVEDAIGMLDAQPAGSRTLLSNVRADLRRVIGDVRSYVYDLHDGDGSIDLRPALDSVAANSTRPSSTCSWTSRGVSACPRGRQRTSSMSRARRSRTRPDTLGPRAPSCAPSRTTTRSSSRSRTTGAGSIR
jgi:signal transduction histidine kinase